jgi:hypothetical protein
LAFTSVRGSASSESARDSAKSGGDAGLKPGLYKIGASASSRKKSTGLKTGHYKKAPVQAGHNRVAAFQSEGDLDCFPLEARVGRSHTPATLWRDMERQVCRQITNVAVA